MNKDDGEVVIRWLMTQDMYFYKQGIEKSSRDFINSLYVIRTVWKISGISVTIRSVLNRFEDRGIQINSLKTCFLVDCRRLLNGDGVKVLYHKLGWHCVGAEACVITQGSRVVNSSRFAWTDCFTRNVYFRPRANHIVKCPSICRQGWPHYFVSILMSSVGWGRAGRWEVHAICRKSW